MDDDAGSLLGDDQQTHVVQIVREVLSNILATLMPPRSSSRSAPDGDVIELRISDDGNGFDPGSVRRGHVLSNMEERARKLGGTLEISPRNSKGTQHTLWIPKELGNE